MTNSTISIAVDEQLRIVIAQRDQLELENSRVVSQLKEVIKMNSHWQRYDSQREAYVIKLTKTNRELQDTISDLKDLIRIADDGDEELGENPGENNKNNHTTSKKNASASHHLQAAVAARVAVDHLGDKDGIKTPKDHHRGSTGPQQAPSTTSSSSGALSSTTSSSLRKDEEIAALTHRIASLNERVCKLDCGRSSKGTTKEGEEQLVLLREQVNVCVEDFKQERRDRERCQAENEMLRERLARAEDDLRSAEEQRYVYQEELRRLQEGYRSNGYRSNGYRYNQEPIPDVMNDCNEGRAAKSRTKPRMTYFNHGGTDMTDAAAASLFEIDGIPEGSQFQDDHAAAGMTKTDDKTNRNMELEKAEDNDDLQCPRCLQSFSIDKHDLLLDHINTCLQT